MSRPLRTPEPVPASIGDITDGLLRTIAARMTERTEFRESLGAVLHALRDHEVRFQSIGEVGSAEDAEVLKEIREGYRHLFTAHQLLKGSTT